MVFEAASWVYRTFLGAHNNLYKDPKNWQRLADATQEAFPHNRSRRLSGRAPSRFQHIRARRRFLNGDVLDALRDTYRAATVDTSIEMGIFDPKRSRFDDGAGSFSRPDRRQIMAGDLTWASARYKRHRSNAYDPKTGKVRRHDPDADYYHDNQGKRSGSPGRGPRVLDRPQPVPQRAHRLRLLHHAPQRRPRHQGPQRRRHLHRHVPRSPRRVRGTRRARARPHLRRRRGLRGRRPDTRQRQTRPRPAPQDLQRQLRRGQPRRLRLQDQRRRHQPPHRHRHSRLGRSRLRQRRRRRFLCTAGLHATQTRRPQGPLHHLRPIRDARQ